MASIVPLGDHVVVKAVEEEVANAAGILLPKKEEKPQKGLVVAVGPGKMKDDGSRAALDVQVGDTVLFKKYAPDEFEIDGQKVLVLTENDILAKVAA